MDGMNGTAIVPVLEKVRSLAEPCPNCGGELVRRPRHRD